MTSWSECCHLFSSTSLSLGTEPSIAAKFSQSGEATEKLLRNLGTEYQRVKQQPMLSGAATETPVLRGSPELFAAYEEYYSLYYPQGGSTLPKIVLTESTIVQ